MKVKRHKKLTANVTVVSVGLDTYWKQFSGLLDKMKTKTGIFVDKLSANSVNVTNIGMVDNAIAAAGALRRIKTSAPDVLFVDMVTYAASSTFGMIVRAMDCPVVLVALQELPALDCAHATTFMQLCNDDICAIPEFTGVAERMGHPVADVIIGMLEGDSEADAAIAEWCRIAHVRHDLSRARLGHMGHVLEAMLDMQTDPAAVTAAFGAHVVQCEPDDIMKHYAALSADSPEVVAMSERIFTFFDMPDPVSDPITSHLSESDLATAARVAVALERFIAEKSLDGFAYYYEAAPGSEMRKLVTNFIVGNSLLTGAGFPMCGEFDIKTCIAMMIMDRLEAGGSFAEFHPVDFTNGTVLVGHDGPHHINIADRKPVLRSLAKYHGKPGSGASVEFNINTGPITMLSIGVKADGKFKFVIAEGESVPGPIPPTGNTNTHGKFSPDVKTFLRRWCMAGPTHHFALGIGHFAGTLKKVADSFGIENLIVTER
ncbi:MAG: L-arabinose isomerase [Lentisphaerae bacterium ADurb.Bin242]|nr:MAG: L-arabinose isomerase [Lentisphaerae bacterium ADurb.Bin242]